MTSKKASTGDPITVFAVSRLIDVELLLYVCTAITFAPFSPEPVHDGGPLNIPLVKFKTYCPLPPLVTEDTHDPL
jgi:hypothetical protein